MAKTKKLHLPAFDIIGSREKAVAIVDIPKGTRNKKRIAETIIEKHRNVKTVIEKGGPRKGVYRIRDYKILAGDSDIEVVHKEGGCRFLLDPCRVYFSQREGTERGRIAAMVKNRETVMVFFAGVGPFPIIISKKSDAGKIIGIEINPAAAEYFRKNVSLNKCLNIEVVEGDVREKAAFYSGACDRVLMPLPEKSIEYMPEALSCARPSCVIQMYFFSSEDGLADVKKKIRGIARKSKRKIRFLTKKNVLPYGPRIWKMRLDMVVE